MSKSLNNIRKWGPPRTISLESFNIQENNCISLPFISTTGILDLFQRKENTVEKLPNNNTNASTFCEMTISYEKSNTVFMKTFFSRKISLINEIG